MTIARAHFVELSFTRLAALNDQTRDAEVREVEVV